MARRRKSGVFGKLLISEYLPSRPPISPSRLGDKSPWLRRGSGAPALIPSDSTGGFDAKGDDPVAVQESAGIDWNRRQL